MGHALEVCGGRFVAPDAWIGALTSAGFRAELMPDDNAPIVGGTLVARFGHPSITGDDDIVARIDFEFFRPAADAPEEVIAHRREHLAVLQLINAPWSVLDHEGMMVAWLEGGRSAIVEYLDQAIAEREEPGEPELELRKWREHWQGRGDDLDPRVESSVLFHGALGGASLAVEAARWFFAAAYAAVANGALIDDEGKEVATGPACLTPESVVRDLAALRAARPADAVEADERFSSWDVLQPSEPEDD